MFSDWFSWLCLLEICLAGRLGHLAANAGPPPAHKTLLWRLPELALHNPECAGVPPYVSSPPPSLPRSGAHQTLGRPGQSVRGVSCLVGNPVGRCLGCLIVTTASDSRPVRTLLREKGWSCKDASRHAVAALPVSLGRTRGCRG